MYVPDSKWPQIKEQLLAIHKQIKLGDVSGESITAKQLLVNSYYTIFSLYILLHVVKTYVTLCDNSTVDLHLT